MHPEIQVQSGQVCCHEYWRISCINQCVVRNIPQSSLIAYEKNWKANDYAEETEKSGFRIPARGPRKKTPFPKFQSLFLVRIFPSSVMQSVLHTMWFCTNGFRLRYQDGNGDQIYTNMEVQKEVFSLFICPLLFWSFVCSYLQCHIAVVGLTFLYSWGWSWSPDLPDFDILVLGLQACSAKLNFEILSLFPINRRAILLNISNEKYIVTGCHLVKNLAQNSSIGKLWPSHIHECWPQSSSSPISSSKKGVCKVHA